MAVVLGPRITRTKGAGIVPAPFAARVPSGGRRAVLEHALELVAEFRRVLVAVHRDSVLDRGLEQLFLVVGRQGDRAFHFTGIAAAIDIFAWHGMSPYGLRFVNKARTMESIFDRARRAANT